MDAQVKNAGFLPYLGLPTDPRHTEAIANKHGKSTHRNFSSKPIFHNSWIGNGVHLQNFRKYADNMSRDLFRRLSSTLSPSSELPHSHPLAAADVESDQGRGPWEEGTQGRAVSVIVEMSKQFCQGVPWLRTIKVKNDY